jgi:hypothetical protein
VERRVRHRAAQAGRGERGSGHRPEAGLREPTYNSVTEPASSIEDWRGVDVGQIRAQLRLPVKERVRVMVEAANVLLSVQDHARQARSAEAG